MSPPPGRMRPGEALPPREAFPSREAPPFRAGPPRGAPPFRESPPSRPGPPPRHGNPARDARESRRPDVPVPPFDPGHPSRGARPGPFGPGPGSGTGRPSAAPGYGPSAGRRPAPPSASSGPGGPGGTFDGGYAQVIRPTDHPVPPGGRIQPNPRRPADPAHPTHPAHPAHPAGSARPADQDVYVYRDVSDPAPRPSARHAAADDAAYWYDLLAEDPAPKHEDTRGPFEPLLSSTGTPGSADGERAQRALGTARDEQHEPPEQARARKLEQLKDLYLTAEAIGERNVDKHFDQLLAQQRELISEYFRQSTAAQPGGTGQAGRTEPQREQTGGQATPPEGVSVRAEPPHAW